MEISNELVNRFLEVVIEETKQACRYRGKVATDSFDDGAYKEGYLAACDHLGVDKNIHDHVMRHRTRILDQVFFSDSSIRKSVKFVKMIHETDLPARIKNILYRGGFERICDLTNLSRYRFLKLRDAGLASLEKLESYLGRPLSDATFPVIVDETQGERDERYKAWLLAN